MSESDVERSHGMHVVHDGPRQAPPLLLVHGSGASGGTWKPMIPALAAHRHVIRVDLPGCGQSPPAASYDVPDQADRVAALLDGLGLGRVDVAGHSSGGYVATALAERRPDLVGSLALISSGPDLDALLRQPLLLRALLSPPLRPLLFHVPPYISAVLRGERPAPPHAKDGGDCCYAPDAGRAIALLMTARTLRHDTYNVSSGRPFTNREFAEALEAITPGLRLDLLPGRRSGPGEDPYLDIGRLTADTGFTPEFDVAKAVADYVAWRAGNPR
ncbi:pimeloyl-ACP methyl ester carboxylesterase [Actinomadura coerulea]|uniref:Pimeloyl-ACP methyl ester carboxylesterase n=1 Tax=Actinomadura coerulea TaxID=46159 RepID=A0A7X0KZW5_9ACTN|nr:alpha/beta hydrolase [Actinomadura coerulea]MBB6396931.1 pimeloyl-ACP methyl ester carboxylesterase [Actinomadura coerulea]GGP95420.1 hypothetical protein GCM10010187_08730 [Actinomadura coerulea]